MPAPFQGIHTALVTPFTDDDRVDLDAYERLCARQLDAGIHGVVACGTTGETPTLSADEWADCVRAAVSVAKGRGPVTAGVGTNDTRGTVRNVEEAARLGADAGLLVFPYYNKPNAEGLRRHVRAAAAVGLPLVLYHVPGRTGQRLGEKLLAELCEVPGVIALKEATGDLRYGTDVIRLTRKPVLSGDDFTFLGLIAQGGRGCVSVLSNVAPAQTVAVWDAYEAGRVDQARDGFLRLYELVTYLFAETNPIPVKECLAALGLCSARVRLPLAARDVPAPVDLVKRALG